MTRTLALPSEDLLLELVLTRAADELVRLAAEVEQLQDVLSDILLASASSPKLLCQAQALDHVHQHVAQLGALLDRVARASSPDWRLPSATLLSGLSLSGLAGRLNGAAPAVLGEDLELW